VTHTHDHDAAHHHHHEDYTNRPHPEFVVLDIGDDVGALAGTEVHISPAGDDARRQHKDVLERSINGEPAYTAVFDGLRQGAYTLWSGDVAATRGVTISGGTIAEVDWRS
jgi:hypothetical protein